MAEKDTLSALRNMFNVQSSDLEDDEMTSTNPMTATPTQMANLLFPNRDTRIRARRIFDKVRASKQCQGINVKDTTNCWLCGNMLNHSVKYPDPLAPQCDHILPVVQGIIFLELYGRNTEEITPAMEAEYAWSHAICNNLKSNSVFIKVTSDGKYDINDDAVDKLLRDISNKGIPLDVKQRKQAIKEKLNPVISFLIKDGIPGIHDLNVLAGVISILESSGGKRTRKRTSKLKRTRRNKRK